MIVPSQKYALIAFVVISFYLLFLFRDSLLTWRHRFANGNENHPDGVSNPGSELDALLAEAGSDTQAGLDDCGLDNAFNGKDPPTIIQCSMKWGEMAKIYSKALNTHVEHGRK